MRAALLILAAIAALTACERRAAEQTSAAPGPALSLACDGPIQADTTRASLAQAFGAENVADEIVPGPEGTQNSATVLFPKDPLKRLEILWGDETAKARPLHAMTHAPGGAWAGPAGLKIGSPIAEVEKVNGKPFRISGFNWDYGGYANDWQGGALASAGGCTIGFRFDPKPGAPVDKVSGEGSFASDSPEVRAAGPVVSQMSLGYPAAAP